MYRTLEPTEAELAQYASQAVDLAVRHVRQGGAPFTALVVQDGEVVATGVNRVHEEHDATAHAEIVALREATRAQGAYATAGALLVASAEPCALCYLTARWAGVAGIAFAVDRHTAARAGFDYSLSYRIFAKDPADWPLPTTHIPVPEAQQPFRAWRAHHR